MLNISAGIDRIFSPIRSLLAPKNNSSNLAQVSTQTEVVHTRKDEIPSHLIDAITQEIIINPYSLKCGHSYGKLPLTESLRFGTTCPQCRAEVTSNDVKPNPTLVKKIQEYVNKTNPLNNRYYEEEKASVLESYGHLANESIHPGETVRRRSDFPMSAYPSSGITTATTAIRPPDTVHVTTAPAQPTISILQEMLYYPTDRMADLFFNPLSELTPANDPESRIAEYNELVRVGRIPLRREKGDGLLRFKKYFSSLFNTETIPSYPRARTLYYSGFSGKLKKMTHSCALQFNKIFNSHYQKRYSPRSIYMHIETQAKNGYLFYAESLVTSMFKNEDVHWRDKSYAMVAKEHIATEISEENLNEVYRLGRKIQTDKTRDDLFVEVAKECSRKKEYTKARKTVSKISAFFRKIFLFDFIGLLATVNFFHTMINVTLLPFRYIIKIFIED